MKGKRKKRQTEEEVGKQYAKVDRNRIVNSARVAENRTRWKGLLQIYLWCPNDLPRLWDRIKYYDDIFVQLIIAS